LKKNGENGRYAHCASDGAHEGKNRKKTASRTHSEPAHASKQLPLLGYRQVGYKRKGRGDDSKTPCSRTLLKENKRAAHAATGGTSQLQRPVQQEQRRKKTWSRGKTFNKAAAIAPRWGKKKGNGKKKAQAKSKPKRKKKSLHHPQILKRKPETGSLPISRRNLSRKKQNYQRGKIRLHELGA